MLTTMRIMMDQLSAQGMGALNTSLSLEADPWEGMDFFFKAQVISKC